MNWFTGTIPEAILAAKERDGIFVVFIHDKSDSSKAAQNNLNSEKISKILTLRRFVCIQLENGSQEAKQFSQIYPLIVVPSLFLIKGQTGIPVEVIGGDFSEESLLKKLDNLVETSESITAGETSHIPNVEGASLDGASASLQKTECKLPDKDAKDDANSELIPDSPNLETDEKAEENSCPTEEQPDLSDRVERAKVLLEEKQMKKEIEKQEDDKRKELERRRQGQGMAYAKQRREEAEMKELAMQRKKDKEDDRIHRERVKAQIAADRVERERREALFRNPQQDAQSNANIQQQRVPFDNSLNARIKFRFPDSSSINGEFLSDDPLSVIRNYVRDNSPMPLNNFNMVSILHHHPFTDDQLNTSLRDLGLTPSATITIKPTSGGGGRVVPSAGSFYDTFWFLLSPIVFVLNYFKRLLGLSSPPETDRETNTDEAFNGSKRLKTDDSYTVRSRPKSSPGTRPDVVKREGNIHRLNRGGQNDDDDENNTWNGNSTQQM